MKKLILLLLVFNLLVSCNKHTQTSLPPATRLYSYTNLEENPIDMLDVSSLGTNTGWNIYKDIMFPGTSIQGELASDSLYFINRKVLNCRITEGDAYNNLFFTNTLAKSLRENTWFFDDANHFEYSMDFYVYSHIDSIDPDLSEVEGIEFTFQHALPAYSNIWALQWNKSNVWSYWNDNRRKGEKKGWIKIPEIKFRLKSREWNKIVISGHHNKRGLHYDNLYLNNTAVSLNKTIPKALLPSTFVENYIQVGFQINGNKAIRTDHKNGVDPVSVYLDNVHLEIRTIE